MSKKNTNKPDLIINPRFVIGLNVKDIEILKEIHKFFGVGLISISNDIAAYHVYSVKILITVIIPHFIKYPLLTQKQADFLLFKEIIELKVYIILVKV